ncbi:hypothetical protein NQ314_003809 [Rhamnusium bicolor]|uniref:Peptidase S1 domain-containing protein n=1 Tax=Rhamnusium bicolor TaxID=1586634 RepID=A0AAV8ZM84_9CUCU|nr:hypothetical protein NQ314_003809 [Rhamnusium bicolor]
MEGTTTDILQKVQLPTQPLSLCIDTYRVEPAIKLSYKQMCVGGTENKDSCGGDSGGPFHIPAYFNDDDRYVQQGIVSIGPSACGTIGFPGVYTRIAYYMQWILDNIEP